MRMTDEKAFTEKYEAGPRAEIFYRAEGAPAMDPMTFVWGYVHMLVTSLVLGFALYMVSGTLDTYRKRVLAVVTFGLAAAIYAHLANPVWFLEPWHYLHCGRDIRLRVVYHRWAHSRLVHPAGHEADLG